MNRTVIPTQIDTPYNFLNDLTEYILTHIIRKAFYPFPFDYISIFLHTKLQAKVNRSLSLFQLHVLTYVLWNFAGANTLQISLSCCFQTFNKLHLPHIILQNVSFFCMIYLKYDLTYIVMCGAIQREVVEYFNEK